MQLTLKALRPSKQQPETQDVCSRMISANLQPARCAKALTIASQHWDYFLTLGALGRCCVPECPFRAPPPYCHDGNRLFQYWKTYLRAIITAEAGGV